MIQVGFNNYVPLDSIRAVGHPSSAPMTRLVTDAKGKGLLIDFTAGRKCKGILILDTGQVVLSSLSSDTLAKRVREAKAGRHLEPQTPGVVSDNEKPVD